MSSKLPREALGQYADSGVVLPLDLEAELVRWGTRGAVQ